MSYISEHSGEELDSGINQIPQINIHINDLQSQINELKSSLTTTILNTMYPIGSLYTSFNSTNPSSIIGGTWEQIEDCFLMAAGSAYAINTTGGAIQHTHDYGLQAGGYYRSVAMESNTNAGVYTYDINNNKSLGAYSAVGSFTAPINSGATTTNKDISMTHFSMTGNVSYTSNLPPYQTIYMWKRIS